MKFLLALTTLAIVSSAIAAPGPSATLELKGSIDKKVSIDLIDDTGADSLDLVAGAAAVKIATLTERSTSKDGYTVSISSANGGELLNGSESITYSITYGGEAVDLDAGSDLPRTTRALGAGVDKDVEITFAAQDEEATVSGDYTDTITFSIAAD